MKKEFSIQGTNFPISFLISFLVGIFSGIYFLSSLSFYIIPDADLWIRIFLITFPLIYMLIRMCWFAKKTTDASHIKDSENTVELVMNLILYYAGFFVGWIILLLILLTTIFIVLLIAMILLIISLF